jgi:hypothetical protein
MECHNPLESVDSVVFVIYNAIYGVFRVYSLYAKYNRFMNPTITVIRCIGTEFARRLLCPITIAASIVLGLLVVGVLLLGTLNSWWLLLLIPVVMLLCIVTAVLTIVWLTIRTVTPVQSKTQRRAVKAYVDKLQRISDAAQTPKIILLFRIVRDVAAPRNDGFISSITDDTASLKRGFQELRDLF